MNEKGYFIKRNNQGFYFANLSFKDEGFVVINENDIETIPFEQIEL